MMRDFFCCFTSVCGFMFSLFFVLLCFVCLFSGKNYKLYQTFKKPKVTEIAYPLDSACLADVYHYYILLISWALTGSI